MFTVGFPRVAQQNVAFDCFRIDDGRVWSATELGMSAHKTVTAAECMSVERLRGSGGCFGSYRCPGGVANSGDDCMLIKRCSEGIPKRVAKFFFLSLFRRFFMLQKISIVLENKVSMRKRQIT